jgi:hypothetical protein
MTQQQIFHIDTHGRGTYHTSQSVQEIVAQHWALGRGFIYGNTETEVFVVRSPSPH